ncbi:MAG: energy transducer TonB [Bacteroidota bacterium]
MRLLSLVRLACALALPLVMAGCASTNGGADTEDQGGRFQGYPVYLEAVYEAAPDDLAEMADAVLFNKAIVVADTLATETPSDRLLVQIVPHADGSLVRFGEFVDRPSYFHAAGIAARLGKAYADVLVGLGGEYREDTPFTASGPARIVPQATGLACPEGVRDEGGSLADNGNTVIAVPETSPSLLPTREMAIQQFYTELLDYPLALRGAKVQGTVFSRFILGEDGVPTCGEILIGLPGGLNENVLTAIGALRFEPGKVANDTVEVLYVWPVPFNAAPPQQRR